MLKSLLHHIGGWLVLECAFLSWFCLFAFFAGVRAEPFPKFFQLLTVLSIFTATVDSLLEVLVFNFDKTASQKLWKNDLRLAKVANPIGLVIYLGSYPVLWILAALNRRKGTFELG